MSSTDPTITSYAKAPAKTVTVGKDTFAYREYGPAEEIPVIFFVHLAATLDNWDPRIVDAIAKTRRVITFDQLGVGALEHAAGVAEGDVEGDGEHNRGRADEGNTGDHDAAAPRTGLRGSRTTAARG